MFGWWGNKDKKEFESNDYNPGKDWMAEIRKRQEAEKKRKERWSKEFKKQMNTKNTYTHVGSAVSSGTYSGNYIVNSTSITTTSIADAKIRIDGGVNGSMQVDVPLIVNGRDVMKELDEMRDAMLLLKRDVDMESKYPRLRELKDEYERALEKYKTFESIKESK